MCREYTLQDIGHLLFWACPISDVFTSLPPVPLPHEPCITSPRCLPAAGRSRPTTPRSDDHQLPGPRRLRFPETPEWDPWRTITTAEVTYLRQRGVKPRMNLRATSRDLLYPTEWVFRFFVAAMLIRIASPQRTYAFPYLADSFIFPLGYYLLFIGAALWFAVQMWVLMKYVSSRRENAPLHQ